MFDTKMLAENQGWEPRHSKFGKCSDGKLLMSYHG
jgi:hypothetical protein